VYPLRTRGDTERLTALHLPIALWLLAVGAAYVGGRWFASVRRMDFVRFSGELAIYYVLIALGGGVVTAFTFMMFSAIDMNPDWFVWGWLIPCGAAGSSTLGAWLLAEEHNSTGKKARALARRSSRSRPASPSLASLPTEWRLLARISFCWSTWHGRRGSIRASCVTGVRLLLWSDGRSLISLCTPHGLRLSLSCSRHCLA